MTNTHMDKMFSFSSQDDYQKFIQYLFTLQDVEYKKFHKGLFKEDICCIGIRTPELKKMAKEIAKGDYQSFFRYNTHMYYEESVIHGLVLGYLKLDFNELLPFLSSFLPFNTNWAINDITCSHLKIFKNNKSNGLDYIQHLLDSKNAWNIRFALVLLLNYYVDEIYMDFIFESCNLVQNTSYYVKMAKAWLLSVCFIKYKEETYIYLKNNQLDDWTYNKTISKICESYRVAKEDKIILKGMKK